MAPRALGFRAGGSARLVLALHVCGLSGANEAQAVLYAVGGVCLARATSSPRALRPAARGDQARQARSLCRLGFCQLSMRRPRSPSQCLVPLGTRKICVGLQAALRTAQAIARRPRHVTTSRGAPTTSTDARHPRGSAFANRRTRRREEAHPKQHHLKGQPR